MILMRVPPRPGADDESHVRWLQQKHVAFVQNWRDELGVLPRSTDAIDPRAAFGRGHASGAPPRPPPPPTLQVFNCFHGVTQWRL